MIESSLTCHPSARPEHVSSLRAGACIVDGGKTLSLSYRLEGDLSQLRIPELSASRRADTLWERMCFEVFLKRERGSEYFELNFSPSSEWAAYGFTAYREGMRSLDPPLPPRITVKREANILSLAAHVGLAPQLGLHAGERLRLALSAVVEDGTGRITHWALAHPSGKPDFHHPDGFILSLEGSVE